MTGTQLGLTSLAALSTSPFRSIIEQSFFLNNNSNNSWLRLEDAAANSDNQPFIVPYAGKIKKVSWTAPNAGADTIQIFKNAVLALNVTNTGLASGIRDIDIDVVVSDRISIFINNTGTNYTDLFVILYFEVST